MTVTSGSLTIPVDLSPDQSGSWWFSFEIPNYAGRRKLEAFRSKIGYKDRETAGQHAVEAVRAGLSRHYEGLGQKPPDQLSS